MPSLQYCFTFGLDGSGWGLKTHIIVRGSSHHIFYDGEKKKFVSLLADMEKKGREHIDIVWKFFENCGNFKLLKIIHFYGGTTTLYCNNFLLIFK